MTEHNVEMKEPFKRKYPRRPRLAPSEQTSYVPVRMWASNVDWLARDFTPIHKGNRSRAINYAVAYAQMAQAQGLNVTEVVNAAKRAKWWERRALKSRQARDTLASLSDATR